MSFGFVLIGMLRESDAFRFGLVIRCIVDDLLKSYRWISCSEAAQAKGGRAYPFVTKTTLWRREQVYLMPFFVSEKTICLDTL